MLFSSFSMKTSIYTAKVEMMSPHWHGIMNNNIIVVDCEDLKYSDDSCFTTDNLLDRHTMSNNSFSADC